MYRKYDRDRESNQVQGEGGVHPATQEFMKGLKGEFCDEMIWLLS